MRSVNNRKKLTSKKVSAMKITLNNLRDKITDSNNLEESLALTHAYASLLHSIDIGKYDDPELEQQLIERFKISQHMCSKLSYPIPDKDALHIITEAYNFGGHTRLMEMLASMHETSADLLVTRNIAPRALERISKVVGNINILKKTTYEEKINEIIEIASKYKKIVLHIHANDILSVIACGVLKNILPIKIYLVNHADHAFTLGSFVADYYFELSKHGHQINEQKNISGKISLLGIPLKEKKTDATKINPGNSQLKFLSSGSGFKYTPFRGDDIRPLIIKILTIYQGATITIIGVNPLFNYWWWPLKLRFMDRLKLVRFLPYEKYLEASHEADFFIDSYPFPGGTAFAEQVLEGKRGIGLISKIQGYSPADKLKRKTPEEVISCINNYDEHGIINDIISFNGFSAVKERYISCLYNDKPVTEFPEYMPSWTGDSNYLEYKGVIFTPIDLHTIKYLMKHEIVYFLKIIKKMSLINKIYIAYALIIK